MHRLIQFLLSHECAVAAEPAEGGIAVTAEVVTLAGLVMCEREVIPATLAACRDWLGY